MPGCSFIQKPGKMKNRIAICIVCALCVSATMITGQVPCVGGFNEYILHSNNIRASFFPRGNKFTDGSNGRFLAPYPSEKELSTIFASSVWIGGFDDALNLKLAVEGYPPGPSNPHDYTVGPLNSIGLPYDTDCSHYDRAWSVDYEDIQAHREDFMTDFKIDDTIESIFSWPARGNSWFPSYYGFELPFDNFGLAPFSDENGNNIYDPENGDYPAVLFSTWPYVPDQILWMVFNDVDTNYTSGNDPLRFEIQLTAFAFHCEDNDILNNTIFNSYRILNRSITSLDSLFFGFWTDYDLGCSADDFIGSDSARSTEFVYNADALDGDFGTDCSTGADTYADQIPVQSMTYLSHPMHSFISAEGADEPIEYFSLLNGQWADGNAITPEGDGYNPSSGLPPTRFLFSGDPTDTESWSANNVSTEEKDQRVVSSISLGRGDPGEVWEVLTAHMFHYYPEGDHLDQITTMYSNIDSLRQIMGLLHPHLEFPCMPVTSVKDPGIKPFVIYPNPATSEIILDIPQNATVVFYSLQGMPVMSVEAKPHLPVDVSSLPPGLYIVSVDELGMYSKLIVN
jgi:hypothetical protein